MFTKVPTPFPDEALTSYIQRLSSMKLINPMALWRHIITPQKRYPQSKESDTLDHIPNKNVISALSKTTGLPENLFEEITFLKVIKNFVGLSQESYSKYRILANELCNTRKFCPICLKENGFYKLIWQVKEVDACLEHSIYLFDQCPDCQKPIYCLYPWAEVGYCQCGFDLKTIKLTRPILPQEIFYHELVFQDWNQLLTSHPFQNLEGLDNKRSFLIAVLFLANKLNPFYSGLDNLHCLDQSTSSSLLQGARGTKTSSTFIHLRILLNLLRQNNMSVEQFFSLKIPQAFIEGILTGLSKFLTTYSCKAPWCPSYQKNQSLLQTGTTAKQKVDRSRLKYYFYCQDCGIEYAINETGKIIERGYFIEIGWYKVKKLVLSGKSRRVIAKELGITVDQVIRCIAYFAANGLIPLENVNTFLGKSENQSTLQEILTLLGEGKGLKEIHRMLDLPYHEFLFYRYKSEVINKINCRVETREQRLNKNDCVMKVEEVIKSMLRVKEEITIQGVARRLNVCPETLRNWGVLSIVANYKERQKMLHREIMVDNLRTKASTFIESFSKRGLRIDSQTVYEHLGVKRNVLVREHPEVTSFISNLLKRERAQEQKMRIKQLLSITKEVIEEAQKTGDKVTLEDIADALDLSVAGVQRYPQIVEFLKKK